jgi:multidrug resistance efflux pump
VEHDAEPRNKLLTAEEDLRSAQQSVLEENTAWTSTRTRLEQDLRDANLVISKSEKQQAIELEDQWVRSPVSGLISDIRITGVTTKGVTLEVMILEQEIQAETVAQVQE